MPGKTVSILLLAIVLGVLFPRDAFAYLDPGTGSMVFQTVVAGLAAVAYGVRMYWGKIRSVFSRRPPVSGEREGDVTHEGR